MFYIYLNKKVNLQTFIMKRVIVDYRKLTPEILSMLVDKYPYGYDDDHIIKFKNAHNETIEAVEVRTDETIYLVKVSTKLENSMASFEDDDYDNVDYQEAIVDLDAKKHLDEEE